MEDSQRETMFNAWKNQKVILEPKVTKTKDYCIVEVDYRGINYHCKALQSSMFGSTNTYNYAFNRVLSDLLRVNEKIEMTYHHSIENMTDCKIGDVGNVEEIVEEVKETTEPQKTIVINLFGAPGSGKSTLAAVVFGHLKKLGVDIELVVEYAKELVWEERNETMKDEIYIFAKQNHRFFRLKDKVKIIITDRPIALSKFYNLKYGKESHFFNGLVDQAVSDYENFNVFLKKGSFDYNPDGRLQSEEESKAFEDEMCSMFLKDIDVFSDNEKEVIQSVDDYLRMKGLL